VSRRARIVPGPGCGWPDRECKEPDSAHGTRSGERRSWGYHDVQCQVPNSRPGPYLDGYPECGFIDGHAEGHDYRRHAAEKASPEPELEAGQ
jgi:hypothetical protein